ncbi:hypothetical protein VS84_01243 [Vibrio cholerae]|nr:hypothetical protein VS84_01243 [Vibrio cholerae]KKP22212.1 hypothetical protein VS86_02484 [Vibrio cholerae]
MTGCTLAARRSRYARLAVEPLRKQTTYGGLTHASSATKQVRMVQTVLRQSVL